MLLDALSIVPGFLELRSPLALWLAIGLGGSLLGAVMVHLDNRRFRRTALSVLAAPSATPVTTPVASVAETEPVAA